MYAKNSQWVAGLQGLMVGALLGVSTLGGVARAEVSSHTMSEFTSYPITVSDSVPPEVVIAAANDHSLFFKAYNDYTDLDGDLPGGDAAIETTYKNSIDYYGYFDSYKCYNYDTSSLRFEPVGATANKYCNSVSGAAWSGNFLNWVSMSRIDIVRKILFGGHRRVDSATETVLERAFIPNDAHSWAKFYNGSDLSQLTPFSSASGVTICNTTVPSDSTKTSQQLMSDPPMMRVARGDFSLWAANERWQCRWYEEKERYDSSFNNGNDPSKSGINASSHNPRSASDMLGEYVVRVHACVSSLIENERCKQYPNGNYKPVGLLQKYGDDDQLKFAMFAGSYNKNKSGGILIKNVGTITDEINSSTDGTFSKVALSASNNGVANNTAEGIINAWSLFRIVNYKFSDGTYGTSGMSSNNCTWGRSSFSDGQCQNWGNPLAEIMLNACRYLANEGVSGTFRSNPSAMIDGLQTPISWSDPLDATNYCSRLSLVLFNGSTISYDADQLDGNSEGVDAIIDNDSVTSAGLTDAVGAAEGIHGNDYFVGENGTDNNQLCTSKTVSSLGNVEGICPEAPRLDGSYRVAGLAHYVHTNDIRPDNDAPSEALKGSQTIDTYAVSLSKGLPQVTIPDPSNTNSTLATILPACRNSSLSPEGNCTIVDFKIVSQNAAAGTGKFYVNWEDSEQGGDYDQDMWGTIDYAIVGNQITVTTDVHAQSTPYAMGFGYIISGTTNDGFHVHSGINGFTRADTTGATACSNCQSGDAATSSTYTAGTSSASLLKDPLWYAAKYGGFSDQNGNNLPDLQSEWDRENNNTGLRTPDGIPDNYFYASNPLFLEASLDKVFEKITKRSSSGTAAAVVANSASGEGAIYQAYYVPKRVSSNSEATWIGSLHGLWVDSAGLLREDTQQNAVLDDYDHDLVVEFYYDEVEKRTRFRRVTSLDPNVFERGTVGNFDIEDLRPIWNAREELSGVSNVTTQRWYGASAAGGRFIKTWVDEDLDGIVDAGEYMDFTAGNVTATNYGYFDEPSETAADTLVNYIRGQEVAGYRNRTVDFDDDGNTEVMRLGDIVNSTPVVVGRPAENIHLLFEDQSYQPFFFKYRNRRQIVYVGSNDGMLHAFNAGFYNPVTKSFSTTEPGCSTSCATAHPLGSEIWAYVPGNLLPHLKWLADPDYTHVYYVDATPYVFDAKIFPTDATHVNGWGTVMVAGFRLGGGPMTVDTEGDGLGVNNADSDTSDDFTFSSAYAIFDITDPESQPELLAEIRLPGPSFSTSWPTAFAFWDNATGDYQFYLGFGNGPNNLHTATSTTNAFWYVVDLKQPSAGIVRTFDTGVGNSFVGSTVTADWDLDLLDDTVYFGVSGGPTSDSGRLMRFDVNEVGNYASWTASMVDTLVDAQMPVTATPSVSFDELGNHWVFFGTGRFMAEADKTNTARQAIVGIKDDDTGAAVSLSSSAAGSTVVDVSDIQVFSDGTILGTLPTGVNTFGGLEKKIEEEKGWIRRLSPSVSSAPSERVVTDTALIAETLFATSYTPNTDLCLPEGTSALYGLYYKTGTGHPDAPAFGTSYNATQNLDEIIDKVDLGRGLAASPSLHSGSQNGNNDVTIFSQTSTGKIERTEAKTKGYVRSGELSWREIRE